ncbi:MAG: glycosyltransferase, partial [bacterium]
RWLGIVLGDQAIFCSREAFRKAGGFPRLPIMEDYEFWKRLRRAGRTTLLPLTASTSARRWREHGTLRTTLVNQAVMWLYMAGISPERLARWYRRML